MFEFAMAVFFAMTLGYIFGRWQQFNIDDVIPILFIIEKEEKSEKKAIKQLSVVNGNWVKNENSEDAFSKDGRGLLIPSDRNYSMYFPINPKELEGKTALVNSGKRRLLRNSGYLKRKYYTACVVKK